MNPYPRNKRKQRPKLRPKKKPKLRYAAAVDILPGLMFVGVLIAFIIASAKGCY